MNKVYKILVVDDNIEICHLFEDIFENENSIKIVITPNPFDALRKVKEMNFDMVIADINMPQIPGHKLLKEIKQLYPKIKVALLTGYQVDNYLRIAKEYGITNIITKDVPFDINSIKLYIKNLLTGKIFGLKNYLNLPYAHTYRVRLGQSDTIEYIVNLIENNFRKNNIKSNLKLPLWEILTNAIYHAPRKDGKRKYQRLEKIDENIAIHDREEMVELLPKEKIIIEYGWDDMKYGVSVSDPMGTLRKEEVIYYLTRNIPTKENEIPAGLLDGHGRGFFLIRESVDRMIINIAPNEKTEIIVLNFFEQYKFKKNKKPLLINEV